jgi:hypothetical protein
MATPDEDGAATCIDLMSLFSGLFPPCDAGGEISELKIGSLADENRGGSASSVALPEAVASAGLLGAANLIVA